ncbi:hypothetical protein [Planotetraspora kaengkrachanensis]|uniref:DinB family protein n=1 Tax=Planotetraspora kaengkrachanensis TaxID=575193 RepID=A0A8J3VBL3_9ACTN|nr:hypothetical protein [Planotetraspora kaengkrachanensis]GIG84058.1 hypothetical protein Pka01_71850 [Planotetraspora kaengkrachanensis]
MTRIYVEKGTKKIVACSLDWPGWARIGTTEDNAVATLTAYADRYRLITEQAGLSFDPGTPEVVARVAGVNTTDWGAPAVAVDEDAKPYTTQAAARTAAILRAAWACLDHLAVSASPVLRKGPRGGGRDRDEIVTHVIDTERVYARKIGIRHRPFTSDDHDAVAALRDAVIDILGNPADGMPLAAGGWPPAYAARRFAWHVLDHVWEIQDKSQ